CKVRVCGLPTTQQDLSRLLRDVKVIPVLYTALRDTAKSFELSRPPRLAMSGLLIRLLTYLKLG
ncbi:MAG: hypothetical protein P8L31_05955, partial [Pseudomonadales bacterium]|nr:hypothetical protein [Pseudomonadales bacterium]